MEALTSKFLKQLPDRPNEMEQGVLYVSTEYMSAVHLCPCGCRTLIVTPISTDKNEVDNGHFWLYSEKDGLVTLAPSISNPYIPCRSHYYISDNRINHV